MFELGARLFEGREAREELGRHQVDHRGRRLVDDPDLYFPRELGDHEMRAPTAAEEIVIGLDRLDAVNELGPELAGLRGQDDVGGDGGTRFSCVSSRSCLIQSWQHKR